MSAVVPRLGEETASAGGPGEPTEEGHPEGRVLVPGHRIAHRIWGGTAR